MVAFSIGHLSRKTGVKVPTIRYCEEVGVLKAPVRTASNRRVYTDVAVNQLLFIRHARALGFAMTDIRALLNLQDNPAQSCRDADRIARVRLVEVEERIRRLGDLRHELKRMIEGCRQLRVSDCRVIEILADQGGGCTA